ncbi:MAG: 2-methylthioadenine synthetase, partial [Eggerthellaceae bacterium]|nr:2-methylthioadenine synthetase [Eggerthellaceae bacterium]
MNFAAVNLGCKVNHVEMEEFAALLIARGACPVDAAEADVIIINTCTVTGEAERKTRKAVNRALAA